MPPPDGEIRWCCGGCGNLARFDVTRRRHTTEYWHFDIAGSRGIQEVATTQETIESVSCRWCGRSDVIELIPRTQDQTVEDS